MMDLLEPTIIGHCKITDIDSGEVLVDKTNSINFEAMSRALALSLAARPNGSITQMAFGNGASSVSSVGTIVYLAPNVTGLHAALYHQTYSKYVNDLNPLDTNPLTNHIRVSHTVNTTYSDVTVTCVLDYAEPSGQDALDDASDPEGTYIFDEIGLTTADGTMLTHVIFHPVQKSLSRRIEIFYTIRILMV